MKPSAFFVIHEFTPKIRDDLRGAIKRAFRGTSFEPAYADDDVGQRHILEKIKTMIEEAEFIICDVSNSAKPNVFLELGYAIAFEKRCYIICEAGTPIASDLAGIDRIEYESYEKLVNQIRRGIAQKEIQIGSQIVALRKARYREEDAYSESDILKMSIARYAAIDLRHKFGTEVSDTEASSGKAWKANLSTTRNHLIYGPYEILPDAGKYRVFFKLKLSHNSFGANPVLKLDVFGAAHAERHIYAAEFNQPKRYQLFALDFDYSGAGPLEYRIYNISQSGTVWVDYIAVAKI